MSNPANLLDEFATYTCHFELHAAPSDEILMLLEDRDVPGASTTSRSPNGTLLINTRRDAHQTIDNVKVSYIGPSSNPLGLFTPSGEMSLEVYEPNGMNFIEKISNVMKLYDVSTPSALSWALKIFMVGRRPDNSIDVLPKNGALIPMEFKNITGDFSYQGGKYVMTFVGKSTFAGQFPSRDGQQSMFNFGYCNKNICITAKTIKDALSELEIQLNKNYDQVYENELKNEVGAKRFVYKINIIDKSIDGHLSLNSKVDWSPDSGCKMNFLSKDPILKWIYEILRSSKDLNSRIADSLDKIKKENHEGVEYLVVVPYLNLTETSLEINYDISLYKGGPETLEFDYLFGDPGKNVDVISFNMTLNSGMSLLSGENSNASVGYETARTPDLAKNDPSQFSNVVTQDKTKENAVIKDQRTITNLKKNDIAILPSTTRADSTGYLKYSFDAVPATRKMFATVAEMHAAYSNQFTFMIRGNLNLLLTGIISPKGLEDTKPKPCLTTPLWIKVNIKDQDGEPFFYTGKYELISIENNFSGGKFTQNLTVMMHQEETNSSTGSSDSDVVPMQKGGGY
jgi:hypothetical protein